MLFRSVITIPNWGKHQNLDQLESKKEYMRNYMKEYREKQNALVSGKKERKVYRKTNNKTNVSQADIEEDKDIEREGEKKSKRETSADIYLRILPEYVLSDRVKAKVSEWIAYKTEKKDQYKEQGLKALLRQIESKSLEYGEDAICDLIDECMSNGYKGIIFDKLKKQTARNTYQKQTKADELDAFYKMAADWGNQ